MNSLYEQKVHSHNNTSCCDHPVQSRSYDGGLVEGSKQSLLLREKELLQTWHSSDVGTCADDEKTEDDQPIKVINVCHSKIIVR